MKLIDNEINQLMQEIDAQSEEGHNGTSMARTMYQMKSIALHGFHSWKRQWNI